MAHKKGVGSSENGRDSKSKRLGVKLFGGQAATAGNIIIRQRGSKYHIGDNVYMGKDWTIHAKVDGKVAFKKGRRNRTVVYIIPNDEVVERLDVAPTPQKETVKVSVAKTVKAAPVPDVPEEREEEAPPVAETTVEEATSPMEAAPPEEVIPVAETLVVEAAPATETAPLEEMAPVAEAPVEEDAPPVVEETPVKEEAPKVAAKPASKKAASGKDDFRKIEGIGPKIASLLNDAGILTFAELSTSEPEKLKEILTAAGSRYSFHNPTTWPDQAKMAAEGRWDDLKKWQDESDGGKPIKE